MKLLLIEGGRPRYGAPVIDASFFFSPTLANVPATRCLRTVLTRTWSVFEAAFMLG